MEKSISNKIYDLKEMRESKEIQQLREDLANTEKKLEDTELTL